VTAPAAGPERPASPPMQARDFAGLADEVAAACQRFGVRAWSEDERERLDAALWRFVHPDLAHGQADPYTDPDDN
jgi:DNA polymerase IIIc chi subunit